MLMVSFLIAYLNHPLCFFLIRLTYIYLVCMCVCGERRGGGGEEEINAATKSSIPEYTTQI